MRGGQYPVFRPVRLRRIVDALGVDVVAKAGDGSKAKPLATITEALAAARSALAAVPPRLEEAARGLGRRPLEVLGSVTLPLMRRGLLAGLGLVFLTSLKELPATLILRPIGFDTLAIRVWSYATEGVYSRAAVPALLLDLRLH